MQTSREHLELFDRAHRTLVIYTRTATTIQKAWEVAGDISHTLYSSDITVEKLERVLVGHYGLPPVRGRA